MDDAAHPALKPAAELAAAAGLRIPNESAEYRAARLALLAEEIELRRHIERVAAQRRALPPGGPVIGDYRFEGEEGEVGFEALFRDKPTLVLYSYMFGPQRKRPCSMCTAQLSAWEGNAADLDQRLSLAVVARSPYVRLRAWKQERGWKNLRLYSDLNGDYSRDYFGVGPDGADWSALNVFSRRDGTIRCSWVGEINDKTADLGQDARGAPETEPLWNLLDMTPEGRDPSWYPKLEY